jgi:hypothetical protein
VNNHTTIQSAEAQAPTINDTFDAKGFTAILALPISTLQNLPLPSQLQGSVFGGIWSFRVVKGNLQDFKLDLNRVLLAGKTGETLSING